jgi:hypothetical protein
MKPYLPLFLVFFFSLISFNGFTQQEKSERSIREQIETEKIAFFTEKIGLTLREAERFWPVYNEYWNKKNAIINERKQKMNAYFDNPESFSQEEIRELADSYVNYRLQKAKLLEEYHEKFKEILPVEKVMKVYLADYDFKTYLLKKLKSKGKNE